MRGVLARVRSLGAGCALLASCATAPPGVGPAPSASSAPSAPACAIVPWNCTCSWECRTPNEATCANACPNLDDPSTREPPPKRPCGLKDGVCAFLD